MWLAIVYRFAASILNCSPQASDRQVCDCRLLTSLPRCSAFLGEAIGPVTDVYHVALYAYYRLAGLLPGGFPGGGVEAFDFALPPLRIYRPDLPPGVAAVIDRGLMHAPWVRFTAVADLCDALDDAVAQARARRGSQTPIRVETAGGSVIGAMHVAVGLPNQDAYTIEPLPDGLYAIVADGVSVAAVGSGDRASRIVLDRLAAGIPVALQYPDEAEALTALFRETSEAVLADALGDPPRNDVEPTDVMSSTVLAAALRGNELLLATVGDSRAYLVTGGAAEQLTVDGDVRCAELAVGLPPEHLRLLGHEGYALFTCLGVGERTAEGRLVASAERARPTVSRWSLLPGDVVVLCTDGLAEEGVFLGSADLRESSGRCAASQRSISPTRADSRRGGVRPSAVRGGAARTRRRYHMRGATAVGGGRAVRSRLIRGSQPNV